MCESEKVVRIILCSALGVPKDTGEDVDLLTLGMDSLNCLKIVVAIEDEFNIVFPEERIKLKYLRTIKSLCETVGVCLGE